LESNIPVDEILLHVLTWRMSTEPKPEFHVALNVMGLMPRHPDYWKESFGRIRAELANEHKVLVSGWIGAYVGKQPFFLFALLLDLDKPEDMQKYKEVEAKVSEVITKYVKQ
jgi:hypothetical protein